MEFQVFDNEDSKMSEVHQKKLKKHIFNKHKFQCSRCPESFQSEKTLKQHRSKSHSKSISKKFTCRICSAEFNTFNGVRKHKKESHMELSRTKYNHSEVDMSEYSENPNLLKEIETVRHFFTDEKFKSSNKTVYSFRMKEFSITFLKEK